MKPPAPHTSVFKCASTIRTLRRLAVTSDRRFGRFVRPEAIPPTRRVGGCRNHQSELFGELVTIPRGNDAVTVRSTRRTLGVMALVSQDLGVATLCGEPEADPTQALIGQGVSSAGRAGRLYDAFAKPVLDFIGGVILSLLLLPVGALVAIAVRLSLGKGVVYRQERIGRGGRPFTIYKFRTMHPDRRGAQMPFEGVDRRTCHKRDDDPRHTSLGRFLRQTRLDELPQMWNVVRGQMSLVGPRPELPHVVARYEAWQHDRHQVKPGLTGLWQVSDRAGGLAYEGVDLDIQYVHRLSFLTDCAVLLRTVPVVVRRTGR